MLNDIAASGINLKLVISRDKLQQVCDQARLLACASQPIQNIPVFEEYYEGGQEVDPHSLMEHIPKLLEAQYEILKVNKIQQVKEYMKTELVKKREVLKLKNQFELTAKIRELTSKKNDLIEQHSLVNARLQGEQNRIDLCNQKLKYLRDHKEIAVKNDMAEIELQIDLNLRRATAELQQLAENCNKQVKVYIKTAHTVSQLNKMSRQQIESTKKSLETTNLWAEYYKKSSQLQSKVKTDLAEEQQYITLMLKQFEDTNTLQQLDYKNTIKDVKNLPEPATQHQMQRHLSRIEHSKRCLEELKHQKDDNVYKAQSKRLKREIKKLVAEFEEMIHVRQLLKQTLKM